MKSRNIILSLALMGCTAANALTLQQAKKIIFRRRIRQSSVDIPGTRKKNPGNASYNHGTVPAFMKPVARLKPENISRLPTTNA